ncbi:MAG: outer membrane beta-barrel protein [Burkholderiales bacterium]|nr:outer membrane beta-barrel protein [Burkholderiales bacterium]
MRKSEYFKSSLWIAAGSALLTSAAFAQQMGTYSPTGSTSAAQGTASEAPGSIPLGPINAYPSVGLSLKHDDNLFSTPNNTTGDTVRILTPSVRLEAKQAANTYSLTLGSTLGRYNTSTADDYTNYNVNALADLDLTARFRAKLKADYIDAQDPRGSTNNALSAVPDRYRENYLGGVVSYGAQGAQGRVDFELGGLTRRYYNNRATTFASDRDNTDTGATFYWRIAPKTSLLLQAKHTKIDYLSSASTQDSTENRLLGGVTWEATAKTTGIFKLGMVKKSFEDPAISSSTQASWEGAIKWSPRTYSTFDFNLGRAPAETTGGLGNYIDKTTTGAVWTHQWTSRVTTAATASYMTDQYKGFDRKDNTQNYGLKATYSMRRWLNFGADYGHTFRDSNDDGFDYKRNTIMLFVNATL